MTLEQRIEELDKKVSNMQQQITDMQEAIIHYQDSNQANFNDINAAMSQTANKSEIQASVFHVGVNIKS